MKRFLFLLLCSMSLSAAPQAVVFDFGGVMTHESNTHKVIDFLKDTFNLSNQEFEAAQHEKRLALKAGKTDEEFWIEFAEKNNLALPDNWEIKFKNLLKEAIGINKEMYALVNELKRNDIPVALLSNINKRYAKFIEEFGFYAPFDPCLLSCYIGAEKPNSKAYEILLDRLDLPPEDVFFVDDLIENVEGAKVLGMDAILFQSKEQLENELKLRKLL